MKNIIYSGVLMMLPLSAIAGNVSGKILVQTNENITPAKGSIFIGKTSHLRENGFPGYLAALSESTGAKRLTQIDAQGNFAITNVPEGEDLIVGIDFDDISYFVRINLNVGENVLINRTINLTGLKSDFSVKMINGTGIVFADFAGISYLIQDGQEGWVFSGDETLNSLIAFKKIPIASYSLHVLNKVGITQPDRVDTKIINVTQNMPEEITFEIK